MILQNLFSADQNALKCISIFQRQMSKTFLRARPQTSILGMDYNASSRPHPNPTVKPLTLMKDIGVGSVKPGTTDCFARHVCPVEILRGTVDVDANSCLTYKYQWL